MKIKPCPKCGGSPELIKYGIFYYLKCSKCNYLPINDYTRYSYTIFGAKLFWNRRILEVRKIKE